MLIIAARSITSCDVTACIIYSARYVMHTRDLEATFGFVSDVESIFNKDLIGAGRILRSASELYR